ncbi:MAG TPA: heme-binding beta-barrel domain-containing protein [Steroidobacteraceae bacterium]|nr:heme-binding beta-barrel domain-containing protein [Steroidobacteraceae bacterium]
MATSPYGDDIYTEPADVDGNTLANLGPLRRLAGRWRGTRGVDVNPKPDGPETAAYIETIDLEPIDPQTNGPQLLYGLRYHQHVIKPGERATYHDQVGYWLWEPATGTLYQTLTIPRGQSVLATGRAAPDATRFELEARRGTTVNGIVSQPFLESAFTTLAYRIVVTLEADGGWSYDEDTLLQVRGQAEPFHHTDRSTLTRVAEPQPNPLVRGAGR